MEGAGTTGHLGFGGGAAGVEGAGTTGHLGFGGGAAGVEGAGTTGHLGLGGGTGGAGGVGGIAGMGVGGFCGTGCAPTYSPPIDTGAYAPCGPTGPVPGQLACESACGPYRAVRWRDFADTYACYYDQAGSLVSGRVMGTCSDPTTFESGPDVVCPAGDGGADASHDAAPGQ
jgi:hypothetical protein